MAEKYERLKVIGRGTFGLAWLTRSRTSRRPYVVKEIRLAGMKEKDRNQAVNEVAILAGLKHVNVVRYREAFVDEATLHIAMEYADGGDLSEKVLASRRASEHFPEGRIIDWFVQICFALRYIHAKKILHRDLKPQNIFLTSKGMIKIGDFGIARMLHDTRDHAHTAIGTPYYMSPEICRRTPYNQKSDMWAAGCILYEMTSLAHPFEAPDFSTLVMKILRGRYRSIPRHYGPLVEDLVAVLLRVDPARRPTADQLLSIPGLQDHVLAYTDRCQDHGPPPTTNPPPCVMVVDSRDRKTPRGNSGTRGPCVHREPPNNERRRHSVATVTSHPGGALPGSRSACKHPRRSMGGRASDWDDTRNEGMTEISSQETDSDKVVSARANRATHVLDSHRQHRVASSSRLPDTDGTAGEKAWKQRSFSVGAGKKLARNSDQRKTTMANASKVSTKEPNDDSANRKTTKYNDGWLGNLKKADASIVDLFNVEGSGQIATRRSLKKSTYILESPSTSFPARVDAHLDQWEAMTSGERCLWNTVIERKSPGRDKPSGRGAAERSPVKPVGGTAALDSDVNECLFRCRVRAGDTARELRGKIETLRVYLEDRIGAVRSLACLQLLLSSSLANTGAAVPTRAVFGRMEDVLGGDKMAYVPVVLCLHNLEQSCDWLSE